MSSGWQGTSVPMTASSAKLPASIAGGELPLLGEEADQKLSREKIVAQEDVSLASSSAQGVRVGSVRMEDIIAACRDAMMPQGHETNFVEDGRKTGLLAQHAHQDHLVGADSMTMKVGRFTLTLVEQPTEHLMAASCAAMKVGRFTLTPLGF